jgi:hypothetical protein
VLNSGLPFGSAASILLKDVPHQRTAQALREDESRGVLPRINRAHVELLDNSFL